MVVEEVMLALFKVRMGKVVNIGQLELEVLVGGGFQGSVGLGVVGEGS
jgi:hypothetical protein